MNFGRVEGHLDEMQHFVVGIESKFYPQINCLYRRRIQAWAASDERP
jgi:hypothetical protein